MYPFPYWKMIKLIKLKRRYFIHVDLSPSREIKHQLKDPVFSCLPERLRYDVICRRQQKRKGRK